MKKRITIVAALAFSACLALFALAGCGGNNNGGGDQGGNAEAMEFIVGFDAAYPPYGFVDENDGSYTGFDLDLAKAVCDANGWTYTATPIDWDAKDQLLNADTITCIWNGFTYEGREDQYAWSEPYMLNAQVIVVKADSGITDFAGLAGKAVMTQVESAALEVLEGDQAALTATFEGGKVQTISDYQNAFLQLDSGVVQAVACDLSIAQYQIAASGDKYVQLDTPLSAEHYAVGFKLGNEALAEQVTATLKQLDADGVVKQLCEKYAAYGMDYSNWCLGK